MLDVLSTQTEPALLQFKNPELHSGLNLTVRNGSKWTHVAPGSKLAIVKTGEEEAVIATGRVFGALSLVTWRSIPEEWYAYEHDPACRTPEGLQAAMDEAYGEGQWGPNVTCLFFTVDAPVPKQFTYQELVPPFVFTENVYVNMVHEGTSEVIVDPKAVMVAVKCPASRYYQPHPTTQLVFPGGYVITVNGHEPADRIAAWKRLYYAAGPHWHTQPPTLLDPFEGA